MGSEEEEDQMTAQWCPNLNRVSVTARYKDRRGEKSQRKGDLEARNQVTEGNARNISRKGNNGGKWFNAHDAGLYNQR